MPPTPPLDTQTVLDVDGYLVNEANSIVSRHDVFRKWKDTIEQYEGGYDTFSKGFEKFGLNVTDKGEIVYREWAPNAREAALIGEFSECAAPLN